MRVVLAVLRYLPAVGGSTRVVQLLAEGLVARGHDVTVVSQEETGSPPEETIAGVRVIRIGMRHVAGFRLPRGYLRQLRRLDADVFHLHGNRIWCADYYFPYARSFEWPQAVTPHNFYHYWMRRGFVRWLYYEQYLPGRLRAFDAYVALTPQEKDLVVSWKVSADRVRVIPNGIDIQEFRGELPDRDAVRNRWGLGTPRVAVYTGGFYDNKRVDRLVRAVASTGGNWGLVVTGPDVPGTPFDRSRCEQLARATGARVRFLGPLPRPAIRNVLLASDAYVQGSAFEGFGVSLLEGLSAGLPFVAFDAGAARALAATGAGWIVGSEREMADRLRSLPTEPEEMRRAALALVREYSAERMVETTVEMYREIQHPTVGRPPPPGGALPVPAA